MRTRADIQILRAVAVLAVIFYHVGFTAFRGGFVGVDIFFVISGYLITSHLLQRLATTGRIDLLGFYAGRIRRLLPASAVLLVVVLLTTPFILPDTRWRSTTEDVIASLFYVQNWLLARRSVNYLSQDDAPSILQHFWSLAVEEQFYILWPALLLVLWFFIRQLPVARSMSTRSFTSGAVVSLAVITISLYLSISYTASNPSRAYFVTFTRAWELAGGGLVASLGLTSALQSIPRSIRVSSQWLGAFLVAACLFFVSDTAPYPGVLAVVPVLGTALLLFGGARDAGDNWARMAALRPVVTIGNMSYSLYIWHWPVIVVLSTYALLDDWWGILIALALSLALATLSYRLIEPIRFAPMLRQRAATFLVAAVASALVLAQAMSLQASVGHSEDIGRQGLALATTTAVAGRPATSDVSAFVPATIIASEDWSECATAPVESSEVATCRYPMAHADGTVVVVGDSHAKQWLPAVISAAHSMDLSVTAFIHDSCPFASGDLWRSDELPNAGSPFIQCMSWNRSVQKSIRSVANLRLVLTSAYSHSVTAFAGDKDLPEGAASGLLAKRMAEAASRVISEGVPVLQINDTPRMQSSSPDCVATFGAASTTCSRDLRDAHVPQYQATLDANRDLHVGALFVDFNHLICPRNYCRPVIGSTLVFRDSNHLTASFARSLSPKLEEQMRTAIAAGVR